MKRLLLTACAIIASGVGTAASAATLLVQGIFGGSLTGQTFSEQVLFESDIDLDAFTMVNGIAVFDLPNLRANFVGRANAKATFAATDFRFADIVPRGLIYRQSNFDALFAYNSVAEEPRGELILLEDDQGNSVENSSFETSLGRLQITSGSSISTRVINGAVPEPVTWAMMIVGFGIVGASMRRRKSIVCTSVRFA